MYKRQTYDKLDRPVTVTNGTVTSSYTYNKNGQLLTDTTGGFTTTYSYNAVSYTHLFTSRYVHKLHVKALDELDEIVKNKIGHYSSHEFTSVHS